MTHAASSPNTLSLKNFNSLNSISPVDGARYRLGVKGEGRYYP